jgi:hypothetical protein
MSDPVSKFAADGREYLPVEVQGLRSGANQRLHLALSSGQVITAGWPAG